MTTEAEKYWDKMKGCLFYYHAGAYNGIPLNIQHDITAALKAQQKTQVSVYGGATGCPTPEPEVVTENKYLHKYIESVNKIGIGGDCAVYNFLFEMNKRHTKFIRENFPNGVKIVDGGE